MAEAPSLGSSLDQLLLRVGRLEEQLAMMDMPFVEDRLDNLERVAAALERAVDGLFARLEAFRILAGALEASARSLERERRVISELNVRISTLETVSRQGTQRSLDRHQAVLEALERRLERLEAADFPSSP